MTDKKTEALKLALEYLRDNQHYIADNERHAYVMEYNAFIESLKRLTEQPAQQPAAWMYDTTLPDGDVLTDWISIKHPSAVTLPDEGAHNIRPLYASPHPSKPWVGLTKEDRRRAIRPLYRDDATAALAACHSNDEYEAIEAKLKEKNT